MGETMEETTTEATRVPADLDEGPVAFGAASELTLGFGGPNSESNANGRSHV